MLETSTGSTPAATVDWRATELGARETWPHALRLTVDIMLAAPCPMLLAWGERRVVVFNAAYAALCGAQHGAAPGASVPPVLPAPMAAAPDAFARAACGEHLAVAHQRLDLIGADGPFQLDCDLQLTPLTDQQGKVGGVLCALARSQERAGAQVCDSLRVLVVEDNLDSQYLVCEMLKAFGHEADGIAHAEGALELLARASYDVLFSDVSLPGMSGVELARQALKANPRMRVIFASGYGEATLRHVEYPFQSLQKPYEIEQLQAALATIVAGARSDNGSPSV